MSPINPTKLKEVAEKVKKMLALAGNNPNIHEAQLAAAKAQEFLEKHGMTLTDVEIQTAEMTNSKVSVPRPEAPHLKKSKLDPYQQVLLNALRKHFFIEVVAHHGSGDVSFLGAKEDVQIASYVYLFLNSEIHRLGTIASREYKERYNPDLSTMRKFRSSFSFGASRGVEEALDCQAQARVKPVTATGTDLMVVKGQAVSQFMHQQFPKLGKGKAKKVNNMIGEAFSKGVEAGNNIQIRRGVSSEGQKQMAIGR